MPKERLFLHLGLALASTVTLLGGNKSPLSSVCVGTTGVGSLYLQAEIVSGSHGSTTWLLAPYVYQGALLLEPITCEDHVGAVQPRAPT